MFSTVVRFWQIFRRKCCRKKSSYSVLLHVTLNNLIEADKRKHLRGEISLVHCRGHDCILLLFYFDGFYDNHRRLLSKKIISNKKKMGCLFSRNELKIEIFDLTPPGDDFDHLR